MRLESSPSAYYFPDGIGATYFEMLSLLLSFAITWSTGRGFKMFKKVAFLTRDRSLSRQSFQIPIFGLLSIKRTPKFLPVQQLNTVGHLNSLSIIESDGCAWWQSYSWKLIGWSVLCISDRAYGSHQLRVFRRKPTAVALATHMSISQRSNALFHINW